MTSSVASGVSSTAASNYGSGAIEKYMGHPRNHLTSPGPSLDIMGPHKAYLAKQPPPSPAANEMLVFVVSSQPHTTVIHLYSFDI